MGTIKKMKMKNLKIYLIAALTCLMYTSCLVDDEIDTDTELFNGPLIVGFKQDRVPANFIQEAGEVFDYNVPVHLLGGASGQPSNSEITVSYEFGTLADLRLSEKDLEEFNGMNDNGTPADDSDDFRNYPLAVEGTHYNFADASQQITIPAKGTFDMIPLTVNNDALDPGKVTLLVLNLKTVTTVDNVVVSEQLKSILVQLQLCRVDLVGNYFINFASGPTNLTVTEIEPGLYRSSYLPPFSAQYTFDFTACAGELTIVGWQFNETNSSNASYYVTQGVKGYVNTSGDLVFQQVSVTDVSWYVNRNWTLTRN